MGVTVAWKFDFCAMNNLCQSQNAYVHDNSLVTSIATSI